MRFHLFHSQIFRVNPIETSIDIAIKFGLCANVDAPMATPHTCNNTLRYKERTIDSLIFTITCNFSSRDIAADEEENGISTAPSRGNDSFPGLFIFVRIYFEQHCLSCITIFHAHWVVASRYLDRTCACNNKNGKLNFSLCLACIKFKRLNRKFVHVWYGIATSRKSFRENSGSFDSVSR